MKGPGVNAHVLGDVVVIGLADRVDSDCDLLIVVDDFMDRGFLKFLVHCGGVAHLDSGGLARVVWSQLHVNRHHGRLALVDVPARVRVLLDVTKLSPILEVFESEAAALSSLIQWRRPSGGADIPVARTFNPTGR